MPRRNARTKILEASFEAFTQFGYQATTTHNIAQKAKVNEVTIFRLFGNKQSLFAVVLEEFIIVKTIQSLDEDKLFEKHKNNALGFFEELGSLSFNYFKETFPFIRMQMMEKALGKLDKEILDRISQIPIHSQQKLTLIFQKCAQLGWIQARESYDPLLISFYGPFTSYLMNKSNFGDLIFKQSDEFMVKELVQNFLKGCLI